MIKSVPITMVNVITKSAPELYKLLQKEVDQSSGRIAIQAGHFALVHRAGSDEVIPAVYEDIEDKEQRETVRQHPYMGSFPLATWKMGTVLGAHAQKNAQNIGLLILVNDWQWIKKVGFAEDNPYRTAFFKQPKLPTAYASELCDQGLGEDVLMPFRNKDGSINNRFFFSEQRLRNQFSNYYAAACDLQNQCAQEYIPLLLQLHKEGVKTLISFIPETCMAAINAGSEKAKTIYGVEIKIINVFANGVFEKNFWEHIVVTII